MSDCERGRIKDRQHELHVEDERTEMSIELCQEQAVGGQNVEISIRNQRHPLKQFKHRIEERTAELKRVCLTLPLG